MKKLSMLILVLAFMLAGCNSETKTLKVFNWGVYMDSTLIDEFEEEYIREVLNAKEYEISKKEVNHADQRRIQPCNDV